MVKWEACRLVNDQDEPSSRDEIIELFTSHLDRGFEETGSYAFYHVNMLEDGEDLTVCMTGNGPRSEKHAQDISLIPDAIREIEDLRQKNDALKKAIEVTQKMAERVEGLKDYAIESNEINYDRAERMQKVIKLAHNFARCRKIAGYDDRAEKSAGWYLVQELDEYIKEE
jgi:DNA repair ATPase RecN